MSKTMAAFYEGPPYLEMLNRIQRQIDLMTRPLLDMQQDYAALTKNLSTALDSPAIRNINKISSAFDSQSMAAIYRTQEIVSKIDMSGTVILTVGHLALDIDPAKHIVLREHILDVGIDLLYRIDILRHGPPRIYSVSLASTPLTNEGPSEPLYFFASSTASSMATPTGTSSSHFIS